MRRPPEDIVTGKWWLREAREQGRRERSPGKLTRKGLPTSACWCAGRRPRRSGWTPRAPEVAGGAGRGPGAWRTTRSPRPMTTCFRSAFGATGGASARLSAHRP